MRKLIQGKPIGEHIDGTGQADVIYGNGGNDGIGGHGGNDKLYGGTGDDRIHGGEDHDTLFGNSGKDTFIFRSFAAPDSDTVADFSHNNDSFELDSTIFTALKIGNLPGSAFHVGAKAADHDDFVIYDKAHGKLFYDDDGAGGHKQHLIAVIDHHANMAADDFQIASPF